MKLNADLKHAALLLVTGILFSCTAMAAPNERGERRDSDRNEQRDSDRNEQRDSDRNERRGAVEAGKKGSFDAHQRSIVRDYYAQEYRAGRCPPGLAKKNNGCNPPGQVKNWQVGQQLPQDVTWYQLSRELQTQLGQAPTGYRYANVDNNILLLELGTQVIVDVIQALGQ